jgi:hypothetical protein
MTRIHAESDRQSVRAEGFFASQTLLRMTPVRHAEDAHFEKRTGRNGCPIKKGGLKAAFTGRDYLAAVRHD